MLRRRRRCRRHPHSTTRRPPIHSPRRSVLPAPIAGSCWHRCRCSGPFTRSTYTYSGFLFACEITTSNESSRSCEISILSLSPRIELFIESNSSILFSFRFEIDANAILSYPAAVATMGSESVSERIEKETRALRSEQTVSGLNGRRWTGEPITFAEGGVRRSTPDGGSRGSKAIVNTTRT